MARTPFLKQVTLPTGNTYTISDYRGSLGAAVDNPTETSLPTASELVAGNFYNVITAGTYSGITAEVGDWIICAETDSSTYAWTLFTGTIDVDQTYDPTSTNAISGAGVADALATLPEPMVFKGTVGAAADNPTITALPVDGTATVGDTYKVITDGTYAGTAAEVGDIFICLTKTPSANTWSYVPSGDESDTWRNISVNGTEKLGNAISTGGVDFVNGTNTTVSFNSTGNKIQIDATDTTYSTTSGTALTGLGTPATDTFMKSVAATTSKLETSTVPNVTSVGSMPTFTVSNEVLTITAGAVPTLGTAITVATGGLDENDASGASIATGLDTPTTASAVTGVTPTSDTFVKTVTAN